MSHTELIGLTAEVESTCSLLTGPTSWLQSRQRAPLIEQPAQKKTFTEEWPNWWIWLIVAGSILAVCLTLIMVILYVFGELTGGESPVYKGYFG